MEVPGTVIDLPCRWRRDTFAEVSFLLLCSKGTGTSGRTGKTQWGLT